MTLSRLEALAARGLEQIRPLSDLAARPGDSDEERLRKSLLLAGSLIILPVSLVWAGLYAAYGEWQAALITFGYAAANTLGMAHMIRTGRKRPFALVQLSCTLLLPLLLTVVLGGLAASSALIIGALMAPLGALLYFEASHAIRWFAAYAVVVALAGLIDPFVEHANNLPRFLVNAFFVLNLVIVSMLAFFQTRAYIRQRDRAYGLLRVEQDKSEGLLMSILPRSIAEILKNEHRTIAERFECVSILFADVVGYTPLSSTVEAAELVELLNEIYIYFDGVVDRYGLEKIRTMGDGYMVASGVPEPRPDHAGALAHAALEMMAFLDHWQSPRARHIEFRMGMNAGPVMAGVIGRRKFSYDVWGDPVNIASRMESHGVPGRIQVGPGMASLLEEAFILEPRGRIVIKGKGEMETWFLIAPRSA